MRIPFAALPAAVLLAAMIGCAGQGGRPGDVLHREGVSAPGPVLMKAVIVDVKADDGILTVKDVDDHATWTITTDPTSRIRNEDGSDLALADIEIGREIRVRGVSRVPSIVSAEEIEVIDDDRGEKGVLPPPRPH